MGTKINPGLYDCYGALAPDEPYFLLRAHDRLAPAGVRAWADARRAQVEQGIKPPEDMEVVKEALKCARDMEIWQEKEGLR